MEDYLKAIYKLTAGRERATTNRIAEEMGVTPASATGMIQKMARLNQPLVEYQKHQGVLLTPGGETAALEVIRHHRLLELYLQERQGFSAFSWRYRAGAASQVGRDGILTLRRKPAIDDRRAARPGCPRIPGHQPGICHPTLVSTAFDCNNR